MLGCGEKKRADEVKVGEEVRCGMAREERLKEDGLMKEEGLFFQEEDGIRDRLVTGVQTCALPISPQPLNFK